MKCWRKRFGVTLLVIVSSCSANGQDLTPLLGPDSPLPRVLRDGPPARQPEVRDRLDADRASKSLDPTATERARKEKASSPMYRDSGPRAGSNWVGKAFEALARALSRNRAPSPPNIRPPVVGGIGQVFVFLVWAILGALLIGFVYFAARHFSWRSQLKRRARAVLMDDEPDYSLDEWLQQADLLESQGRYREAVRALYLACLMRLDEARIARFVRGETNWEHYRRFEQSPQRPSDLEFREPTRAFDRIWYGMQVRGSEDVAAFRTWYKQVTEAARGRKA